MEFDPRHPPGAVALDTSVLSLLDRPDVLDEMVGAVRSRGLVAIVPLAAILELSDSDHEAKRVPRMQAVWNFLDALGDRGVVGADMQPTMRAEWAARRTSPPMFPRQQIAGLRELTIAPGPRPPIAAAYMNKEWTTNLDRGATRAFQEHEMTASLDDLDLQMRSFRASVLRPDPKSFALPFVTRHSSWARKQSARTPAHFPATVLAAGLAQLHAWAALFLRVGYGRWTHVLKGPRRGDWVDMRIANSAAYADVLVSDDEVQRARVNFVQRELGTRARAATFIDWIADV